jgi:hypothetical protein
VRKGHKKRNSGNTIQQNNESHTPAGISISLPFDAHDV